MDTPSAPMRALRACCHDTTIARVATARMPSMHIDRVVLAAQALDCAGSRDSDVTGALAHQMIDRVAEAAPWAAARAVSLTEHDLQNEWCGKAVGAMHWSIDERMRDSWGQVEFIEASLVAIHEVKRGDQKHRGARGRQGRLLVRMLDAASAAAVNRFEIDKALEMVLQLSDAGLDDGKLMEVCAFRCLGCAVGFAHSSI